MWTCRFCKNDFDLSRSTDKANHAKHCEHNPNRLAQYARLSEVHKRRLDVSLGVIKDFTVTCAGCGKSFVVRERENQHPLQIRYFCRKECAAQIGGQIRWSQEEPSHYRTIAFRYHDKRCIVCGEEKILSVHHLDENHENNDPRNLVVMCPTHHQYMHSKFRHLIEPMIQNYVKCRWNI